MKTNFLKWYMVAFLLVGDFVMFAQPGDDNGDGVGDDGVVENDDSDDTAGFPINSRLIWLAVVGIAFAFHYYKKNKEQKAI
ncbi:hypothetical protein [Flavobacterium subsaxonicum]|uniref:Signal peptidase n=1 Tax=Flavobacterium subsaxonicum WB 4.1-42 = DSM 21790 TaxID=1121898 RepID=A0A0A2MID1_9FLAO|nr:hypothetical protein [Flavobacterium subsaxonicum]KGO92407.1 hypothetical protein Q766_13175 [Flavobacterium subsaxonicum WB 4.1-42 = DSM 21790]